MKDIEQIKQEITSLINEAAGQGGFDHRDNGRFCHGNGGSRGNDIHTDQRNEAEMTTAILTDEQADEIWMRRIEYGTTGTEWRQETFRAFEQAFLQSPEIQALRRRVEGLEKIVAECRDAMPIPNIGSKAEKCWPEAMSDAGGVPDFIKASVEALRKDAERYRHLRDNGDLSPRDLFNAWWLSDHGNPQTLDAAIDAAIKEQP